MTTPSIKEVLRAYRKAADRIADPAKRAEYLRNIELLESAPTPDAMRARIDGLNNAPRASLAGTLRPSASERRLPSTLPLKTTHTSVVIILCAATAAVLILAPLLGPSADAVVNTLLGAAIFFVIIPLSMFYSAHPTRQIPTLRKIPIEFLLGLGGVSAFFGVLFLARGLLSLGAASSAVAVVSLYVAHRLWLQTIPPPPKP